MHLLSHSAKNILNRFWKCSTFYKEFLEQMGETDVKVSDWEKTEATSSSILRYMRNISYNHNKRYIVGPSVVPTRQRQEYVENTKNRTIIVTLESTVLDVPYHDYFYVTNRWEFREEEDCRCTVRMGLSVVFLKSTWLRTTVRCS